LKILYVAMKHDYGRPERGYSFEHYTFFDGLSAQGHELIYFDFMTLLDELGRGRMNRRLFDIAQSEQPDLMFTVLFKDELDQEAVRRISSELPTVTLNWFCDDHWRFEPFSSRWAPCFNWVVTTASSALPKYERIGYANVIKSQWGCNDNLYRKLDLPLVHDVSFVGQPHGNRRAVIGALRAAGIDVLTRGYGWEDGRVSQEEMIRIFNQSRINLNLPNASRPVGEELSPAHRVRLGTARALEALPFGDRAVAVAGRSLRALERTRPNKSDASAIEILPEQIKGRNFEVPGCGGFLLTGPADDLERYYEGGAEIVVFLTVDELVDQVRHYLAHEDERRAVAEAGYERTVREHTYARRFETIFATIGMPPTLPPAAESCQAGSSGSAGSTSGWRA
jgi:spore maturation protein CgeB